MKVVNRQRVYEYGEKLYLNFSWSAHAAADTIERSKNIFGLRVESKIGQKIE